MFTSTIRLFIPPPPAPNAEVPLAVWTSPIDQQPADRTQQTWLTRLIDEYALAGQPVAIYTPAPAGTEDEASAAGDDTAGGGEEASPPVDVGLVVAVLHRSVLAPDELGRHVIEAAAAIRPGGRLAVVTRHGRQPKRRRYDPISVAVAAADRHGLGFLQHLVITQPDTAEPAPRLPVRRRGGLPTHHSAHLDVTVFQAPAARRPVQEAQ